MDVKTTPSVRNSKEIDHQLEDVDRQSIVGADQQAIRKGYWYSPQFLGSSAAIVLLGNTLFFGYAVPANLLSLINADIGPSPNIYLVSLMNTLIKGVGLLLVGTLSDVFGRRYFIIVGQLLGFLGAVLSATSTSINMLIGATVFTGLAGCGQFLFPLFAQEIVPNKYRGWCQAAVMFLTLPGSGFGPIIGRSLVETAATGGWRWCYWLNAILTGSSAVLFTLCYHPPGYAELNSRRSRMDLLKNIDYIGFLLYAGGLVCILLALAWGGKQYTWSSPTIIALLVVGPIILIGFVLYEIYGKVKQPLLPMSLFKNRNFNISVVIGSVGQMSFYSLNILWPTHITALYSKNNYIIGWMSCTTGLALTMGEALTGPLFKRLGNIRWQYVISTSGLMLFTGLMYLAVEDKQAMAVSLTIVIGLFIGWVELLAIVVVGLVIPPEQIGTGQAFFSSTRAVTGTISTSIYLAIYTNRLSASTPSEVSAYAQAAGLPSSSLPQLFTAIANGTAAARNAVPGMSGAISLAVDAGIKRANATSFGAVYLSSLAFGFVALVCSFFASDVSSYLTDFVNKTVTSNKKKDDVVEGEKA